MHANADRVVVMGGVVTILLTFLGYVAADAIWKIACLTLLQVFMAVLIGVSLRRQHRWKRAVVEAKGAVDSSGDRPL